MSRILVSGQSDIAQSIANALGLEGFAVRSLQLTIDAGEAIRVDATFYPTEEQLQQLGGELERFRGFGLVRGETQFEYFDNLTEVIENNPNSPI